MWLIWFYKSKWITETYPEWKAVEKAFELVNPISAKFTSGVQDIHLLLLGAPPVHMEFLCLFQLLNWSLPSSCFHKGRGKPTAWQCLKDSNFLSNWGNMAQALQTQEHDSSHPLKEEKLAK